MKCIDPLMTEYESRTFEERSARTESSPRQSTKNSEDDSRANNNTRETLGILSVPSRPPAFTRKQTALSSEIASSTLPFLASVARTTIDQHQ